MIEGNGYFMLIVGVLMVLAGVTGWIQEPLGISADDMQEAKWILLLTGGIFAAIGLYVVVRARREAFLLAKGLDGKGKLLDYSVYSSGGDKVYTSYRVKIKLEVTVPGAAPYNTTHNQGLSRSLISHLEKGMIMPVKVHPEKPQQVILHLDQLVDQINTEIEHSKDGKELKDRLTELEEALAAGLITKDEFESKRTEVMKKL